MRDKASGSVKRVQYDTKGRAIGSLFDSGNGHSYLMLAPGYMLVMMDSGEIGIWDNRNAKLVELDNERI